MATVVGAGVTLFEALKAYEELKQAAVAVRVIDLYSIQPIDEATLRLAAAETGGRMVTVEDHYAGGGLGEAVAAADVRRRPPCASWPCATFRAAASPRSCWTASASRPVTSWTPCGRSSPETDATMPSATGARPLVVLVTGASSGIGKACAELLFARGCRVYGTSRQAPRALVEARTSDLAPLLRMIPLDVTSDDSVDAAVGVVLACEGRLDAVVNNAGFGVAGAAELTTIEEAREQFETNFFGTVRVCRAVLPVMRQQGSGRILNISSIAGRIGIPFQAFYSASKFAIEGFSEALRMEVAPFGVKVVLIEPGDFRTGFTAARKWRTGDGESGVAPVRPSARRRRWP